jgi:hypothetical protein
MTTFSPFLLFQLKEKQMKKYKKIIYNVERCGFECPFFGLECDEDFCYKLKHSVGPNEQGTSFPSNCPFPDCIDATNE